MVVNAISGGPGWGETKWTMTTASEPDEDGQPVTDQALAVPDGPKGVTTFTPEQVEAARAYADASRAASTRAKYLQHWTAFGRWCQEAGHRPLPAEPAVVAVHLSALAVAGTAPQTLALRMAAIGYAHRQAGEVPPHKVRGGTVILDILAGARRSWGKPPARKAAADLIWSMLHEIKGDSLRDVRDRALLSFGMVSCLWRSEITALDVADLVRAPEGLRSPSAAPRPTRREPAPPSPSRRGAGSSRWGTSTPGWSGPPSPKVRCSGGCRSAARGCWRSACRTGPWPRS